MLTLCLQLGWEEEQIWCKEWVPPEELKGPEAHKASTLAGKTYKKCKHKNHQHYDHGIYIYIYLMAVILKFACGVTNISIVAAHETLILPNNRNTSTTTLPFNLITTDEVHRCEISERHHQTQPFEHVHSTESEADTDCVTGNKNNEV